MQRSRTGWQGVTTLDAESIAIANLLPDSVSFKPLVGGFQPPTSHYRPVLLPQLRALGRIWKVQHPYTQDYPILVQRSLQLLMQQHPSLENRRAGTLSAKQIALSDRTRNLIESHEALTPGDYFVVFINFEEPYGSWSLRDTVPLLPSGTPLPLGSVHQALLLRLLPNLLVNWQHLYLPCPGDIYCPPARTDWQYCPAFWSRESGHTGYCVLPRWFTPGGE
jgi:hypothetical protein